MRPVSGNGVRCEMHRVSDMNGIIAMKKAKYKERSPDFVCYAKPR